MKRALLLFSDVASNTFTLTNAVPALPGGVSATICVGAVEVITAMVPPTVTVVAPAANPVPLMTIVVPPVTEPVAGIVPLDITFVTVGGVYMKRALSLFSDVAPNAVTLTYSVPTLPRGVTATICVLVVEVIVAVLLPTVTDVAPVKFVPLITIVVPPATEPVAGIVPLGISTFVTVGIVYMKRPSKLFSDVAPDTVTLTNAVPALPGGVSATICAGAVEVITAMVPPTVTVVAPSTNPVPLITIVVPPVTEPFAGIAPLGISTFITVGRYAN
jgi:hypothetical protein